MLGMSAAKCKARKIILLRLFCFRLFIFPRSTPTPTLSSANKARAWLPLLNLPLLDLVVAIASFQVSAPPSGSTLSTDEVSCSTFPSNFEATTRLRRQWWQRRTRRRGGEKDFDTDASRRIYPIFGFNFLFLSTITMYVTRRSRNPKVESHFLNFLNHFLKLGGGLGFFPMGFKF